VSQASSEGQPLHPARQASGAMPAGGVQQTGRAFKKYRLL